MPLVVIYDLSDILFSFFASCIFKAKDFNCFNSFVPLPSLNWVIKFSLNRNTASYKKIVKRWILQKMIYWVYWLILICISLAIQYTCLWYPFFFCYFISIFMFFFCIHCKWLTVEVNKKSSWSWKKNSWQMKKDLLTRLPYYPSIGRILLRNNNESDEYLFLFDESILLFLD